MAEEGVDAEEPVSAEIIPLPTKPPRERDQDATVAKLYELRDKLTDVLLSQIRRPGVKASMVSAARAFLADQKHLLKEPMPRDAMANLTAAILALKDAGHELPFPVKAKDQPAAASEPAPEPIEPEEPDPFASVRGLKLPFPQQGTPAGEPEAAPTAQAPGPTAVTFNPPKDDGEDF